ncbi:MAG: polysaccharide deacetylase family protein [Candidatus Woesearchaeota archaeon]
MEHFIRKWTANILYYTGLTCLCRSLGNRRVLILAYHRVLDVGRDFDYDRSNVSASVENFNNQMKLVSENYNVLSLDEFVEYVRDGKNFPKNSVIITFDDGYLDSYSNAYPILKKLDIPATIFLTANYIGSDKLFWWDALSYMIHNTKLKFFEIEGLGKISLEDRLEAFNRIKALLKGMDDNTKDKMLSELSKILGVKIPKGRMFLDWQQIKSMSKNKVSFGAHTCNHPILTNISLKDAKSEISSSKSIIEKHIGINVKSFAYPNGHKEDFNKKIMSILKDKNFECAVTYIPGWADKDSEMFALNRVFVRYDDDMIIFKNKLNGMDIFFGKMYYFFKSLRGKK